MSFLKTKKKLTWSQASVARAEDQLGKTYNWLKWEETIPKKEKKEWLMSFLKEKNQKKEQTHLISKKPNQRTCS